MRPEPIQRPFFSLPLIPCGTPSCGLPCRVEACARAIKTFEAIRLSHLGARIALICQLTGIEKTVAKRLRQDLREGNVKVQRARERMGEVPAEVVDGSRRARYAPEKHPTKQLSGGSVFMRPGGLVERWSMPKSPTPEEPKGA